MKTIIYVLYCDNCKYIAFISDELGQVEERKKTIEADTIGCNGPLRIIQQEITVTV